MNMYAEATRKPHSLSGVPPVRWDMLQRCACGGLAGADGECGECRAQRLQRKPSGPTKLASVLPVVHQGLASNGRPLDEVTRSTMEARLARGIGRVGFQPLTEGRPASDFSVVPSNDPSEREAELIADAVTRHPTPPTLAGHTALQGHDFSRISLHTEAVAAESARAVNALAYTVGTDIVFGAGQYVPGTSSGQRLLAHELVHVMQQDRISRNPGKQHVQRQRQPGPVAPRAPFSDQDVALRNVLEASFAAGTFACVGSSDAAACFNQADQRTRAVLVSLYNRLSRLGLWSHVVSVHHGDNVGNIWTTGVGGAKFTVQSTRQLLADILANPRLCIDTPVGALLHKGATSVREISADDSLHVSLGIGNLISSHIDAVSPAAGREPGGRCKYDPTRAAAHIGREVVPLAIPGLQIFPEQRPQLEPPKLGEPPSSPPIIGWGFNF